MNILGSMAGENLFPGFPFIRAFIDAFFRVQGDVLVVGPALFLKLKVDYGFQIRAIGQKP